LAVRKNKRPHLKGDGLSRMDVKVQETPNAGRKKEEHKDEMNPDERNEGETPRKDKDKPEEKTGKDVRIKSMSAGMNGTLLEGDLMTVTIDDVLYYSENKEEYKLERGDKLVPFIIELNDRFRGALKHRIKSRKIAAGLWYLFIVVVILSLVAIGIFVFMKMKR
jgi:hypothetical protein